MPKTTKNQGDAALKFLLAFTCFLLLLGWIFRVGACKREVIEVEREVVYEEPVEPPPPIKEEDPVYLYEDNIEDYIVRDLTSLESNQRFHTRYLVVSDVFNSGSRRIGQARKGAVKAINQISRRRNIDKGVFIDENETILRIDLRDYFGADGPDVWRIIEDAVVIRIVPNTIRNQTAQFFTQTEIPYMHALIFAETALTNETYYDIIGIPHHLADFFRLFLRVNQQELFDDRDPSITLMGFQESVISPDTNRLMLRLENDEGAFWQTYDVDIASRGDGANVFQSPFVAEVPSERIFIHDAQEFIFRLPNGLHGYALFDANGYRANDAPESIVTNVRSTRLGLTPEIRNARDCLACHSAGFIPATDIVGNHIINSQFNAQDKRNGELFYQSAERNDAFFAEDNLAYTVALRFADIDSGDEDPINDGLLDAIRTGLDAKEAAAFLFISEEELIACIRGSENARIEVGQLVAGGTIGFIQFIDSVDTIIQDCNLFIDIE
jgi:hypothetical protein